MILKATDAPKSRQVNVENNSIRFKHAKGDILSHKHRTTLQREIIKRV